jgi:Ca2+-binding EF-hand superfamily protein
MNNKQELTEADLLALLSNNELTNYDPVAEAFKCYDPNDTGYIDLDVFREILTNLGFGDITDQDIQTLIDTCDVDGDGRVSLADFRRMLPSGPAPPSAAAAAAAGSSSAAPTAGIKK